MSSNSTIAIVGASADRSKYGNIAVRAYRDQGWRVYPVNPKAETVEDLPAYASIRDVPEPLERVSVYLPPAVLLGVLSDIATKQPAEVWLNPGTDSDEVVARAEELGLNVIRACSIVDRGVSPAHYME